MIKIFSQTDTSFVSNGDVVVIPLKAKIHKQDNGDYYLDLECGLQYVDYIVEGNIIAVDTPQGDVQAFRITNPQKTGNKITVKAWHVFYDSKNYLIEDSFAENKTCDQALKWFNNATEPTSEYTVSSDVTGTNSFRSVRTSFYETIMTVQERWGGHLVRDNFDIQIKADISHDHGVIVQYKKNLREITVEENWDDVVTKILPVGNDGILLNGVNPSASIYITSDTQYDLPYTKTVTFTQEINSEDYPTEAQYKQALVNDLRSQATAYLAENCVPKVNYTLKAHLDRVTDIGEIIHVKDERLNLNLMTSVIAYEYDCLIEKFTEIEFGNFKPTLSGLIPTLTAGVNQTVNYAISGVNEELSGKQNLLVSGDNIKTINGQSVLGSGNISLLDMFYPVGSYYETSDADFDPNVSWGGTWIKETSGQVHVSAGTGYAINGALNNTSDGGESTHVLTPSETAIRQHAHNIDANDVDAYMLTVPRNSNGVSRRTIKQGTGSDLTNNYYGSNAITRRGATGGATEANGSPHNNMMPYIVVNRWHRTA